MRDGDRSISLIVNDPKKRVYQMVVELSNFFLSATKYRVQRFRKVGHFVFDYGCRSAFISSNLKIC